MQLWTINDPAQEKLSINPTLIGAQLKINRCPKLAHYLFTNTTLIPNSPLGKDLTNAPRTNLESQSCQCSTRSTNIRKWIILQTNSESKTSSHQPFAKLNINTLKQTVIKSKDLKVWKCLLQDPLQITINDQSSAYRAQRNQPKANYLTSSLCWFNQQGQSRGLVKNSRLISVCDR